MKKINMILAAMMIAATGFAKDIKTVVFNTAPEMHCNSCENRIKNGLKFEKGVKDIKTDLETKTVTIEYDADKTSVENIVAAFAKIDYKATEAGKATTAAGEKKMGGCCKKKAAEGATAAGEKKTGGCCKKKAAEGATATAGNVAKFKATQMRCGGCANKVKRCLSAVEGISNVEVDLPTKVVTVNYDKTKTSPEKMVEAFKTINYNVEQL